MWRTKTVIGEQSDLEKLLDQFLERMEQFDKRTSIKEQKTILSSRSIQATYRQSLEVRTHQSGRVPYPSRYSLHDLWME